MTRDEVLALLMCLLLALLVLPLVTVWVLYPGVLVGNVLGWAFWLWALPRWRRRMS